MKKIVIIGAGEFQIQLIEKAKELGYETHVFAWEEGAVGKEISDYFYPISIVEKELILDKCKDIKPECVVSIGSDLAVLTVNYISRELGLNANPEEVDLIATNKYEMRKAFQEANVEIPKFVKTNQVSEKIYSELKKFRFPLIVKPTDRSGSRGIRKVNSLEEVDEAVHAAVKESFEKYTIIEEYVEGNEYSCESISFEGQHYILAFTKKYTTGSPDFIETAHIQPSDIPEDLKDIIICEIKKAVDALHIKTGARHCEFKLSNSGEVRIIEIGARMGGDCIGSDLVKISTGYDYIKMVIDTAKGEQPDFSIISSPKWAFVRFIFNKSDYEMVKAIKELNPDLLYRYSVSDDIGTHKVTDSSSRFGYFILSSENMGDLKEYIPKI